MTRAATWANADGLNVGFGRNFAERQDAGQVKRYGGPKEARLQITRESTFGASGAKITIPAGSVITNVYLKVGQAWAGGTSLAFGDAGDNAGFVTATQGAVANLTAGAMLRAGGAYAAANTDTTAQELNRVYATATDLFVTAVGTFTAGTATIVVEYSDA